MPDPKDSEFQADEGENEETWLLTYVDMVSLLLALFVILFSFSSLDAKKFEAALNQIQASLGGPLNAGGSTITTAVVQTPVPSSTPAGPPAPTANPSMTLAPPVVIFRKDQEGLESLQRSLQELIQEMGLQADVDMVSDNRGVILAAKGGVLFASGEAELRPEGKKFLDGLIPLFTQVSHRILIEGHTDDVPITTNRFPSNWELSTMRATTVLRYMVEHGGIAAARLSAAGYAHHRPRIAPTVENRTKNRRVEIVILREEDNGRN